MEYNKYIADMAVGDKVEGFYILKDAQTKLSAAGKPFLSAVISDCTGSMDIKVWDYHGTIGSSSDDIGKVVKIRGDVGEFKGALQTVLTNVRLAAESDSYDVSRLVPVAPIDREQALRDVEDMVDSITDSDYRTLARTMLARHLQAFKNIPAAKSVHHGFISGLLMHTCNMMKTADFLSGLYAGIVDRSLLLTGTLLHDFAKETEFSFSALGIVTDYSMKGQLLGHLVMGAAEVAETAKAQGMPEEKAVLLQHLILSHHGEPEFGAAVKPMCAEAELLSYIDLIDSRMEIYTEALPNVAEGAFSGRIFALDRRIYRHH